MVDKIITSLRWTIVLAIVAVSGVLMLNAASSDSAIIDELANVHVGYNYFKFIEGASSQWAFGSDSILLLARFGPIFLTLLLILIIYIWAKEIIGRWWALLPAFLFAFSPLVLAHGHYVTTDIGATLGVVAATAMFLRFLFHPIKKNALLAGLVLGLALLVKFSALVLVPYFIFLTIIYATVEAWRGDWGRYFKSLLLESIYSN